MTIVKGITQSGVNLYNCDWLYCNTHNQPWASGWYWYGSIRDSEENTDLLLTFCSKTCAESYNGGEFKVKKS